MIHECVFMPKTDNSRNTNEMVLVTSFIIQSCCVFSPVDLISFNIVLLFVGLDLVIFFLSCWCVNRDLNNFTLFLYLYFI
jgi:hypothetical protein